jgi:FMN phosphatase YigB (HAD superfamily)
MSSSKRAEWNTRLAQQSRQTPAVVHNRVLILPYNSAASLLFSRSILCGASRRFCVFLILIKTIIFDLGNVLIPFDFKLAYAQLEPMCGHPGAEISKRIRSTDLVTRFESGLVSAEQFVEEFSRLLDLNTSYDEFCRLWSSIFLGPTLVPESMLAGLHRRYRLLLLSNTNAIHFPMVRANYPLIRHFDHYVLSYQVRALKPSPKIYAEAVAHADCTPEECFFTDDIGLYVEAARHAGIDAVQFQSVAQLEADLRARGIEW